ncbi:MAG: DUF1501 domain-containing protein [Planctomycetales bacterium]|nr:DUF1501 domain-containing protein [Planctomycetales bacterium]
MVLPVISRRRLLQQCSTGFGAVALATLMSRWCQSETNTKTQLPPGAAMRVTHHKPRAKNVIFCYMSGGVSHVDSFDPKPALQKLHGQPMPVKVERTQFNKNGQVMASPFEFRKYGQCGLEVSSLFPNVGKLADDLAVVRSLTTPVNEHAQGNFLMHTGFPFMGFPSAGAWCSYGLGNETEELPGYVVLQSGAAVPPHGGVSLYSNGFLPAQTQGSLMRVDAAEPIRNIRPYDSPEVQRHRLDLVKDFDRQWSAHLGGNAQVEAAIINSETAFRMQSAVPNLLDISDESAITLAEYGLENSDRELSAYARQCLIARRLVERGVRFVELSCLTRGIGAGNGPNPWDQHGDLERGHAAMAKQVDQPIAALLSDLKRMGLLDETLVVWAGEFGRTPFSQGSNGRDHNPFGFTVWLAGGGVRGGTTYGATDELGYHAVEKVATVYDLWATVLHCLGVNHERLTYRYSGRDYRLTDVFGNVLTDILG